MRRSSELPPPVAPLGRVVGELRAAGSALVGLALPRDCPGCGAPDVALCRPCTAALATPLQTVAPPRLPPVLPVIAVAPYDGVARRVLLAWKDGGRLDLTTRLVPAASAALSVVLPAAGDALVVPLPSAARAVRRRGEDVVARLARRAAGQRAAPVLRQRGEMRDQAGLGAQARWDNVQGSVEATRRGGRVLNGRDVVLFDDVVTTGSTAAAAMAAVSAAGGRVLGVSVICATPRHRPLAAPRRVD